MFKSLNILQPWATVCTTAHIISAWELRAVKTMLVIPGMWLLVGCSCRNLPSENVVPQKVLVWGKKIKSIPQQMNFAPSAPSLTSQSALLSLGFGLRLWSKTRPFIAMTAWGAVPMILGMVRFVLKCRHKSWIDLKTWFLVWEAQGSPDCTRNMQNKLFQFQYLNRLNFHLVLLLHCVLFWPSNAFPSECLKVNIHNCPKNAALLPLAFCNHSNERKPRIQRRIWHMTKFWQFSLVARNEMITSMLHNKQLRTSTHMSSCLATKQPCIVGWHTQRMCVDGSSPAIDTTMYFLPSLVYV